MPRVTSVSKDGFSIETKTFLVDDFAKIVVNGEPAGLGDIRTGMRVLVSSRVLQSAATKADTIYRATRVTARTLEGEPLGQKGNVDAGDSIASSYDDDLDLYGELIVDVQEWTNSSGKKITAGIRSVTAGNVLFVLPTGKEVTYPLFRLSEESQEKIGKLTGS